MIETATSLAFKHLSKLKRQHVLLHCQIPTSFDALNVPAIISTLPIKDQSYLYSIKNSQAQQRSLIARLMLSKMSNELDDSKPLNINTYSFGKPVYSNFPMVHFNISHSRQMVVCAFSWGLPIGIDVEFHSTVELDVFRSYFTETEMELINNSARPAATFYSLWTRKEALIKADGRGMGINLDSVNVLNNRVNLGGCSYHIQNLNIHPNYSCAIACGNNMKVKIVNFNGVMTDMLQNSLDNKRKHNGEKQ